MTDDAVYKKGREQTEGTSRPTPVVPTEADRCDLRRLTHELALARTELKARNDQLRKIGQDLEASRDEFLDLYENAPVAFVSMGAKGLIQRANATARGLMTGEAASPVGRAFSQFVRTEDRGRYLRAMRRVVATNQAFGFELRLTGPRHRLIHAHVQAAPKFDAQGRFRYWHLAFFDISDLRRHKLALLQVHAQLSMAAQAARIGIWNFDLDAGAATWDREFYRLLRLEPREGPEDVQRFFDFIHPEDRSGSFASLDALLDTRMDEFNEEFRIVRADGQIRWLTARGKIFRDLRGQPRHIAGIFFDITSRKQHEEAARLAHIQLARQLCDTERANEELAQYAYAVSHDLKAPLRAVRNYADFLYEDLAETLTGDQKTYLEGMKKAVQQGDNLINDLLNLSRIDNLVLEEEAADIPAMVREIRTLFEPAADLEIAVEPRWPEFQADHLLLKQILHNLISNAVKFNRRSPRRVAVGWQPAADGGIEIFVRDNGIGIAPEYEKQIFRIFQRLHTENEYEGTGIGLAIVRKAAHKLGGTVRLESEPQIGSTFYVSLPRMKRKEDRRAGTSWAVDH